MSSMILNKESIRKVIPQIEEIGEPLSGGQKMVFPVKIDQKDYALKIVLLDEAASPEGTKAKSNSEETIERIRREIEISKKCDCPNLARMGPITLAEFNLDGHHAFYYTEEWIEGQNLESILSSCRLSTKESVVLGSDMATAIEKLWSLKKVHRDIKPSNIIRKRSDGRFVLLDLGIALDLQDVSLTKVGCFPGTFPYFSPEQTYVATKREMDFRSDLFNVGTIMYEGLTGTHPFKADDSDFDSTIENIRKKVPSPPSRLAGNIPVQMDEVIMRLLAKEPHLRYRSCGQLIEELKAVPNIITSQGVEN